MQFNVPQFIETEDKIVGPLSLKQFMYVAVSGGITFVLFFLLQTWVWFVLAILIMGLGFAMAFAKIEGRSFPAVVMSALHFYWNPQAYVWQPEKPALPKSAAVQGPDSGSLERIVQGISLKKAWQSVETGSSSERKPDTKPTPTTERYQVFRAQSGEQRAAKRIDYR